MNELTIKLGVQLARALGLRLRTRPATAEQIREVSRRGQRETLETAALLEQAPKLPSDEDLEAAANVTADAILNEVLGPAPLEN
jgi:hypothetical protein